jgi:predicted nucleic acid-binding protein
VLLWQVACEFVAASRKLEGLGFARHSAFEVLTRLRLVWDFVPPSCAVLDRAEQLVLGSGVAFWDAMIIGAAMEAQVETLFTEDMPAMPSFGTLQVIDPFCE